MFRRTTAARDYVAELLAKRYPPTEWRLSHHLVLSSGASEGFAADAAAHGVGILTLDDLF